MVHSNIYLDFMQKDSLVACHNQERYSHSPGTIHRRNNPPEIESQHFDLFLLTVAPVYSSFHSSLPLNCFHYLHHSSIQINRRSSEGSGRLTRLGRNRS